MIRNERPMFQRKKAPKYEYYFCRAKNPVLIRTPDQNDLCSAALTNPAKWSPALITLYTRAVQPIKMKGKAYICATKKESFKYYTNIVGDRVKTPTIINISAPAASVCRDFVISHQCEQGKLVWQKGNLYATQKPLEANFYGPIEGLFKGAQTAEASNCLLEEVELMYKPHTLRLYSPIYEVSHCKYMDEECLLPNDKGNMMLTWSVPAKLDRPCDFLPSLTINGSFNGKAFLSQDHIMSLTFVEGREARDCQGNALVVSDQGMAIKYKEYQAMHNASRIKREVATTEEVASEIQAQEIHLHKTLSNIAANLCPTIKSQRHDPTFTARELLKRNDVSAKWRSPNLLEVYYCATLNFTQIRFRRKADNCTLYIPIQFELTDVGLIDAYLDPWTKLISKTSPIADCRVHAIHYLDTPKGLIQFDPTTGMQRLIPENEVGHPSVYDSNDTFDMETFHDLVLTNETEVFQELLNGENIAELERMQHFQDADEVRETKHAEALSATPHHLSNIAESLLWGPLGMMHRIWINLCALTVTAFVLFLLANICLPFWMTAPFQNCMQRYQQARYRNRSHFFDEGRELQLIRPGGTTFTPIPFAEEACPPEPPAPPQRRRSIIKFPRIRFRKGAQPREPTVQIESVDEDTTASDPVSVEPESSRDGQRNLSQTTPMCSTPRTRISRVARWSPYTPIREANVTDADSSHV